MWKDAVKSFFSDEEPQVPLEAQLAALAQLGIEPKDAAARAALADAFSEQEYAEDPYHLLLTVLGGCREAQDGALIPNSDRVLYLDAHCAEEPDVYADVLTQLDELSNGALGVTDVTQEADLLNARVKVACTVCGAAREWQLEIDGDLIDIDLFTHLNDLLPTDRDSFLIHVGEDAVIVLYTDAAQAKPLNRVTGMGFYRA